MTKKSWKIACIVILAGLITLIVDWRWTTGYMLGCLVAIILYKRNEHFWSGILDTGHAQKGTGFFHFLINYGLMAGVLILSALYPQYLNIFACAIGMMLIKITSVIDMMFQ